MQERWEEPGAEYALERTAASTVAVAITAPSAKDAAGQPGRVKRFLPFSTGTRDCVGQSLARMNYTTTVAMLLAHFKFQLAPEVTALSLWEDMDMQTIEPAAFPKMQMGGLEGVLASQSSALTTLQPGHGLLMHCVPRMQKPGGVPGVELCVLPALDVQGPALPSLPRTSEDLLMSMF